MEKQREYIIKEQRRSLTVLVIILLILLGIIAYMLSYKLGKIDVVIPHIGGQTEPSDSNQNNEQPQNVPKKDNLPIANNTNKENVVNKEENKKPQNPEQQEKKIAVIGITDEGINFNVDKDLDIFSNPEYNYELIIAPASEYSYQFIVENETEKNITYNIQFADTNENYINLKYKLKLGDSYIRETRDWSDISRINLTNVKLAANSKNAYTLEWKWIESTEEIDTLAAGKRYKLTINIRAQDYIGG